MHFLEVEVYSDQTNRVIVRHPARRFPGVLIQGDSLHALCLQADDACKAAKGKVSAEEFAELNDLRNALRSYLSHYKSVLIDHQTPLPFVE